MLLEISTTIGCPMRCSYCPQGSIESVYTGPRQMTLDTFARALANCPPKIPVSFAGYAEPYLNRECSAMIAHAAALGHELWVYTTGVGMNDADVELLIRLQPFRMVLHLPDGDGDMKAKVTPQYVERIARLAEGVRTFEAGCYGSMHPMLTQFTRYVGRWGLISRAGNVTHLPQVNKRGPLRCGTEPNLTNNILIPSGELALCCCDYGLTRIIGNLVEQTWDQIHAGPAMAEVRRAQASVDDSIICRNCEYAEFA